MVTPPPYPTVRSCLAPAFGSGGRLASNMTSDVKSWSNNSQSVFCLVLSSWERGPAEAAEPVRADG
jgi:hypothetical protein